MLWKLYQLFHGYYLNAKMSRYGPATYTLRSHLVGTYDKEKDNPTFEALPTIEEFMKRMKDSRRMWKEVMKLIIINYN
jgi:hypothetical protein